MRAPLFFFAAASQACVGGYSSAPLVAALYQPSMAPVGLLLAVLGNVAGDVPGPAGRAAPVGSADDRVTALALAAARWPRPRTRWWSARWPTPSPSIRTAPPTSSRPPSISQRVRDARALPARTAAAPEGVLATTWATVDARTLDVHAARRRALPRRRAPRRGRGGGQPRGPAPGARRSPGARRARRARPWSRSPSTSPTPPCWPRCRSRSSACRARASCASARAGQLVGHRPLPPAAVRPRARRAAGGRPRTGAGAPRLQRVVFRRLPGEDALRHRAARRRGGRHLGRWASTAWTRCANHGDVTLDSQTGLNIAFLSINNERQAARRTGACARRSPARSTATALVADVLGGHGEPARNPLPPSIWGFGVAHEGAGPRPRRRRGGCWREAGLPTGSRRRCMVVDAPRPYLPAPLALAARIRRRPRRRSASARGCARSTTWSDYLDRATRGRLRPGAAGLAGRHRRPQRLPVRAPRLGVRGHDQPQPLPAAPPWTPCSSRDGADGDPKERSASYREAQVLFQKDMPWVPLYHVSVFTAYRRNVRGLVVGPTGLLEVRQGMEDDESRCAALAAAPGRCLRPRPPRTRRRRRSWTSCARGSRPWTATSTASSASTSRT